MMESTQPAHTMWPWRASVAVAALLGLAATPGAHAATPCQSFLGAKYQSATVTSAVSVPAGPLTLPNGTKVANAPAFCKLGILIAPTTDSTINVDLWMPSTTWNHRFLGMGNGGYAGDTQLFYPDMLFRLQSGYAVAETDLGTAPSAQSNGQSLIGHPQKWIDFGYRATHLMTTVSQQFVSAFYGKPASRSYFSGCSTGGQQALMEAQRYPADYDGILGGDPAQNRTHVHTSILWNYRQLFAKPDSQLTPTQIQLVTNSVVAACAAGSGGLASDPFLTDPRRCKWDPGVLQCKSATGTNCLNADQVNAVRALYNGPVDPRDGHQIFTGFVRGAENDGNFGLNNQQTQAEPEYDSLFYWVFGPSWNYRTFDFDQNMAEVDQLLAPILNANNADLKSFQQAGHKFLAYHGWADPLISPQDDIDYYLRAVANRGSYAATQSFYRLFMVPGLGHCYQGAGPNTFGGVLQPTAGGAAEPGLPTDPAHDALGALVQWVEKGVAPTKIIATKYNGDAVAGGVAMTRPLCPFPQVPHYKGVGPTTDAASFDCVVDDSTNNQTEAPEYLH
ncbi:MAG: Tannase and feruloyl esterase [Rhodospirillales bacterium]|nr:Tannase and feruloyl esterase [Rhodospirillales bacterium]